MSSGRYIDITLASATLPLQFAPLFAAKYTEDRRYLAQAVSSRVYVTGAGTITFLDTTGRQTVATFVAGEGRRDIEAVGIHTYSGPVTVTVMA
jgi:hypothetical protein